MRSLTLFFVSPFLGHPSILEVILQMLHFKKIFVKQLMMETELLSTVTVKWIFFVEKNVSCKSFLKWCVEMFFNVLGY